MTVAELVLIVLQDLIERLSEKSLEIEHANCYEICFFTTCMERRESKTHSVSLWLTKCKIVSWPASQRYTLLLSPSRSILILQCRTGQNHETSAKEFRVQDLRCYRVSVVAELLHSLVHLGLQPCRNSKFDYQVAPV